jgi:hypothetical protein
MAFSISHEIHWYHCHVSALSQTSSLFLECNLVMNSSTLPGFPPCDSFTLHSKLIINDSINDTWSGLFFVVFCFRNQIQIILHIVFRDLSIPFSWCRLIPQTTRHPFVKLQAKLFSSIEHNLIHWKGEDSLVHRQSMTQLFSLSSALIPFSISWRTASHAEQVILKINQLLIDLPITCRTISFGPQFLLDS